MLKLSARYLPRWNWQLKRTVHTTAPNPTPPPLRPPPNHFQNGETPQSPPTHFQNGLTPPKPLHLDLKQATKSSSDDDKRPFKYKTELLVFLTSFVFFTGWRYYQEEKLSQEINNTIQLGTICENEGNLNEAIEHYLKALELMNNKKEEHVSPNYVTSYLRIAQLYELQGQVDQALDIYQTLKDEYIYALSHRYDYRSLSSDTQFNKGILASIAIATRFSQLLPSDRFEEGKAALLCNVILAQSRSIDFYYLPNRNAIRKDILSLIAKDIIQFSNEDKKETKTEIKEKQNFNYPIKSIINNHNENQGNVLSIEDWNLFTETLCEAKDTLINFQKNSIDSSLSTSNPLEHPKFVALTFAKIGTALTMLNVIISSNPKESNFEMIDNGKKVYVDIGKPEIKNLVLQKTRREAEKILKKALKLCDQANEADKNEYFDRDGNEVKKQLDVITKYACDKSEMLSFLSLASIAIQCGEHKLASDHFRSAQKIAEKLNEKEYIELINGLARLMIL